MPSPHRLKSRLRAAVLVGAICVVPVEVRAQTPRPATPRAQPAPRKPAVQLAAPKPVPAPAKPLPPPPPPDVTVKVKYVTGDNATTSTVSTKGARQRIEYGTELVVLQECDLGRIVQVSDQNKKYLVATIGNTPSAGDQSPAAKAGGVVTYTAAVTDTGERKPMFNVTARHLKTVLTKDATSQACDKKKERVETDGWFIDSPEGVLCAATPRSEAPAVPNAECRDEIRYVGPDISTLGYPVAYTITTTAEDGKTSSMAMEVTDLTRSTLPATLFAVPDGYAEVKTLQDLTRGLPEILLEKQVGTVRIGVAPISSKADGAVSLEILHEALVISLGEAEVDAVALVGATPADLTADARAKQSDFILTTEIAEVKQGGGNRVLGRLSGTPKDSFSAKVDFKLFPVGSAVPKFSDSERSGVSTLQMAIGAAKTVSRFTPMGLMGSRFNFMGTFSQLSNGASPATMQQSPDPVLNTVFSMADRFAGTPEVDLKSEDAAVASAMEREVKAVASEIKKKR